MSVIDRVLAELKQDADCGVRRFRVGLHPTHWLQLRAELLSTRGMPIDDTATSIVLQGPQGPVTLEISK